MDDQGLTVLMAYKENLEKRERGEILDRPAPRDPPAPRGSKACRGRKVIEERRGPRENVAQTDSTELMDVMGRQVTTVLRVSLVPME